jgi:hypothetical protein
MSDDEYTNWFEKQPKDFVHKVWQEGYAEGRMQEKNGIVDFPNLIAPKPDMSKLIKKMREEKK